MSGLIYVIIHDQGSLATVNSAGRYRPVLRNFSAKTLGEIHELGAPPVHIIMYTVHIMLIYVSPPFPDQV